MVTNRLGDVLACATRIPCRSWTRPGYLKRKRPISPATCSPIRVPGALPRLGEDADEQAFSLWLGPSVASSE